MNIVCLDMEGVLVPEIWIAFAEASGIPELKRTTRDEPDYDKLMNWRLGILKEHGLGLKEIQATIATIDPLPGAKEFLDKLRSVCQVIIISDTFTQFAAPLMKKLQRREQARNIRRVRLMKKLQRRKRVRNIRRVPLIKKLQRREVKNLFICLHT